MNLAGTARGIFRLIVLTKGAILESHVRWFIVWIYALSLRATSSSKTKFNMHNWVPVVTGKELIIALDDRISKLLASWTGFLRNGSRKSNKNMS